MSKYVVHRNRIHVDFIRIMQSLGNTNLPVGKNQINKNDNRSYEQSWKFMAVNLSMIIFEKVLTCINEHYNERFGNFYKIPCNSRLSCWPLRSNFDLWGQRSISVIVDIHEICYPCNFCQDRMTLSRVIRLQS